MGYSINIGAVKVGRSSDDKEVLIFIGVLHVLNPKADLLSIGRPRIIELAKELKIERASFLKEDFLRFTLRPTVHCNIVYFKRC